ncbi:unnamed protein product [Meganyctiphanes norvegica]|uniref:Uncharacterized protein n=1 Tax=Meganyctiphanes norvegica TaxID=48144 RepID=A0AAV2RAD4_MEGNR
MAAKHRALEAQQDVKVDIHLDKYILDQVSEENCMNIKNEGNNPGTREISENPVTSINSLEENIITTSVTSAPAHDTSNIQLGSFSSNVLVTKDNNIINDINTHNSPKNAETSRNATTISVRSNNAFKSNHSTTQRTENTVETPTSPVTNHHNNSLKTQSPLAVEQNSSLVSSSSSITNTTVSASAVSSTSEVQQTMLQRVDKNPKKRVIKQAKRRLKNTRNEDAVIAQKSMEKNIKDCIQNILHSPDSTLHSPDSTTSQILLQSISKETTPLGRGRVIRGSSRGGIIMATDSAVRGRGTSRGMYPRERGFGRGKRLQMFEGEFSGDWNAQTYDVMELRDDGDWGDWIEWDDEKWRYDLDHMNFASDDISSCVNRGYNNPSPRGSVFNRLGKQNQVQPQPEYNNLNFNLTSRQEMAHDNFHSESQHTAMHDQWETNQQVYIPPDHFHSELQHPAMHNQRGRSQFGIDHNNHYLQEFNCYLQSNSQQHQSYSYSHQFENRQPFQHLQTQIGPQMRGGPHQRGHMQQRGGWINVGLRQSWGRNTEYMIPNDSIPFWSDYPTNNFPWNN